MSISEIFLEIFRQFRTILIFHTDDAYCKEDFHRAKIASPNSYVRPTHVTAQRGD